MAKGGPIEPFWEQYPFHKEKVVIDLLAKYRIGDLHKDDIIDPADLPDFKELQSQNLGRSDKLPLLQKFPYCAETPFEYLTFSQENWITPAKEMFERNHNLIPEIDLEDYELILAKSKSDENPVELTFDDLKKLGDAKVMATIACAGNKRTYVQQEFPNIKGLKWTIGAIGNALYKGVLVRDLILNKMGCKEEDLVGKGLHLIAEGYDADFQGKAYEVSVPIEYALDPVNEVLLAYEMNGRHIPKMHGFPVRLICPGYIGVRSAKWVHKLTIHTEEADSAPQRRDYKIVPDKDMSTVKWNKYIPVNGQVLNSAVGYPVNGQTIERTSVQGGMLEISGWAHGHGEKGTQAVKVEISIDDGKTWLEAQDYIKEDKEPGKKVFSWTLWKYNLDIYEQLPPG